MIEVAYLRARTVASPEIVFLTSRNLPVLTLGEWAAFATFDGEARRYSVTGKYTHALQTPWS